ncbi:hypothetical protein ACKC9G_16325 [Pokkaliibacter sp. CJK22405]|uniref:hypothetical protein n=1 Tax=Pokkaliibacter sp. CJK22405 TaxID=3384615 RepID=UPI003985269A
MAEPYKPLFNRTYLKIIVWVVAIVIVLLQWREHQRRDALIPSTWKSGATDVVSLTQKNSDSDVWILTYSPGALAETHSGTAAVARDTLEARLAQGAHRYFLDKEIDFSTQLTQENLKLIVQLPADDEHRKAARDGLKALITPSPDDSQHAREAQTRLLAEAHLFAGQPDKLVRQAALMALFPDHPMSQPLTGTRQGLAQLTTDEVQDYLASTVGKAPSRLLLLSNQDSDDQQQESHLLLKALPQTPATPAQIPPLPTPGEALHLKRPQLNQQAALAVALPEDDPEKNMALRLWLTQSAQQQGFNATPWYDSEAAVLLVFWQGSLEQTPPDWSSWLSTPMSQNNLDDIQSELNKAHRALDDEPFTRARWLDLMLDRNLPADSLKRWRDAPPLKLTDINQSLRSLNRIGQATLHP